MPSASDPCRVDQADVPALALDDRVDGVARGARDLAHHGALLAGEPVEETRLAHVWTADDRDARLVRIGLVLAGGRKLRDHRVEEVTGPDALEGGHGVELAEAELVKLRRLCLGLPRLG